MPPSCHDLPLLRLLQYGLGGDRRSWGILASQFQACEGGFLLRGPDAASFSVSPSPRRLCGYSPRSLDPLLTGLLIRSCSLSAACLPSCVALGLVFFDRLIATAPCSLLFRGLGVFLSC